jgi:hypothetical protein
MAPQQRHHRIETGLFAPFPAKFEPIWADSSGFCQFGQQGQCCAA